MYIIIDGYNLLKSFYDSYLEEDRDELLKIIEAYRKTKMCKITVVFDGHSSYGNYNREHIVGGTRVLYSPSGISADRKIMDLVRQTGKGVIIVSSDRALKEAVEKMGAVTISSAEFSKKLLSYEKDEEDIEKFDYKSVKKLKKSNRLRAKLLKKL